MKTKKDKLNFTKCQIINLAQLSKIIGGVGGDDDDDDQRTKSSILCNPK